MEGSPKNILEIIILCIEPKSILNFIIYDCISKEILQKYYKNIKLLLHS
mgnify:CR=1 FL=1